MVDVLLKQRDKPDDGAMSFYLVEKQKEYIIGIWGT